MIQINRVVLPIAACSRLPILCIIHFFCISDGYGHEFKGRPCSRNSMPYSQLCQILRNAEPPWQFRKTYYQAHVALLDLEYQFSCNEFHTLVCPSWLTKTQRIQHIQLTKRSGCCLAASLWLWRRIGFVRVYMLLLCLYNVNEYYGYSSWEYDILFRLLLHDSTGLPSHYASLCV